MCAHIQELEVIGKVCSRPRHWAAAEAVGAEAEEEWFEISDFSTVTPWERCAAALERAVRHWAAAGESGEAEAALGRPQTCKLAIRVRDWLLAGLRQQQEADRG